MNTKVRHELITWGIFLLGVLILVYPLGKLVIFLSIPHWIWWIASIIMGMIWMLVVEWFVTKVKKK
jgi:hypothetical protein